MRYVRGSKVRMTATFRNPASDALFDPDAVVVTTEDPAGATVAYVDPDVVRLGLGVFEYIFDTSPAAGDWSVQFEGTGPAAVVKRYVVPVDERLTAV